ncbi:MAG: hypothetical protein AB7T74_02320 [Clostridia bacterium]
MIQINIDADFTEARQRLRRLSDVEIGTAMKGVLQTLATAGRNWVRRRMAGITTRTGWLKKHVYGFRRSDTHMVVAAPAFKAEPLERGATIRPRKKKYLAIGGNRGDISAFAKQVVIPPKRWFSQSIAGFEGSPEYNKAIDKGLDKAMKKFNGE